jgi:hypothetical protein
VRDCAGAHFIRREGKDTGEAAFSASERHFQDTLRSNRFSLRRETRFQQKPESSPSTGNRLNSSNSFKSRSVASVNAQLPHTNAVCRLCFIGRPARRPEAGKTNPSHKRSPFGVQQLARLKIFVTFYKDSPNIVRFYEACHRFCADPSLSRSTADGTGAASRRCIQPLFPRPRFSRSA